MKVSNVLSIKGRKSFPLLPKRPYAARCSFFAQKKIGCVTVTDAAGQTIGLVSKRDIGNAIAEDGEYSVRAPVQDVMQKQFVNCTSDDYLGDAGKILPITGVIG